MLTLFAIGTIWFWLLLIAAVSIIIYLLEDEDHDYPGTAATIVMVLFFVIVYFLGGKHEIRQAFEIVRDNPGLILLLFGGYIVAGSIWSVVKWYFYVLNARDKYKESAEGKKKEYDEYLVDQQEYISGLESGKQEPRYRRHGETVGETIKKAKEDIEYRTTKYNKESIELKGYYMPSAKSSKSRIMTWMFYWPLSGIWTLINDPIRRTFQRVYVSLEKVYVRISERAFAE